MKKILFIMLVCLVSFSVGLAKEVGPKIEIVTDDANIGEVEKGEIFEYEIEVRNVGREDLIITGVSSGCGCLEITDSRWGKGASAASRTIEPVSVEPDHSIYISLRLDTNKVSGEFERSAHIFSNAPDNKDVAWRVRGKIREKVESQNYTGHNAEIRGSSAKSIMVFYTPGCGDCEEIMERFLPEIKERYGDRISIAHYNIDESDSLALLIDLQNKYDEEAGKAFSNPRPPTIFVEDKLLYGVKEIKGNLEEIIGD